MKKTKRIVSFITATAFLLTSVAPGFAATADEAYGRLNALNVAKGYTDGTIGADKNITRAEFAAVAVRLLGMEPAVNAAKGATKFKDVAASHWGSGYINLAVGNGVIKGYPNGTFAPEANVTYAEASAMLIRVLGYEPQTTGTWPTNYIGKAAQLGLLDGVSATDFNAAATRGNVFLAADNSLDVKLLVSTKDGYEESADSLMVKRLGVTVKKEGVVINVPNYGANKGNVSVDTDGTTDDYTVAVADGVNPNANYGEKVAAWVKDDKAFFFDVKTNASDIILDEASSAATGTGLKLKGKDKTYDFSANALDLTKDQVKRNFADVAAVTEIAKGDKVKVVLDANGKINYIEAWSYTPGVVEEVKAADEKIVFENEGTLELKDDTYTIVKDGKAIALADIKAGDIVEYATNTAGTREYIIVTAKEATGKLTAAVTGTTDFKITVGDKAITTLATATIRYSTDKGVTWKTVTNSDSFKPLFGKDVRVKLNQDGKAMYVIADSEASSAEFATWIKDVIYDGSVSVEKAYVKVGKFDGTNTMYEVNSDSDYNESDVDTSATALKNTGSSGADAIIKNKKTVPETLPNNIIAKVALTADNKVSYVKDYDDAEIAADAVVTIDKTNKTILTSDGVVKVTDDTKIIYKNGATATSDVKTLTWDAFKSLANGSNQITDGAATPATVPVQVVHKDGIAKYVVINGAVTATTDYKYGVISAKGTDSVGSFVEFNQKGTLNRFEGTATPTKETLVRFKLTSSGKLDSASVSAITYETESVNGNAYAFEIVSVDKTNKLIQVKGYNIDTDTATTDAIWILYNADTEVYDLSGSALAYKTIDDLTKGDTIRLYDPMDKDKKDTLSTDKDGVVDFIIRDNDL